MSHDSSNIAITSLGGITPVGANIEQSCAAIKAGIARITEHAYFECTPHDPEWDEDLPLYSSTVPSLDPYLDGVSRLTELGVPALSETMANAKLKRSDIKKMGLFISLPQSDAATHNIGLKTNYIPEICRRTGLTGFKVLKTNQTGRTGVFEHIAEAIILLEAGELEFCLVGGVDSYMLENRLELLDDEYRIKSERNVDGFIPGEAAVMLMLETRQHAIERGIEPIAMIAAVASGTEAEPLSSRKMSTGTGLSDAINSVWQISGNSRGFETVYCSLNGESYFAFEWGIQLARLGRIFDNLTDLIHPAENCGDVGAATGGLLIACAAIAFHSSDNEASGVLLWSSNDAGQRSALCMHKA